MHVSEAGTPHFVYSRRSERIQCNTNPRAQCRTQIANTVHILTNQRTGCSRQKDTAVETLSTRMLLDFPPTANTIHPSAVLPTTQAQIRSGPHSSESSLSQSHQNSPAFLRKIMTRRITPSSNSASRTCVLQATPTRHGGPPSKRSEFSCICSEGR